jgi:toxin ParE1/3/4
VSPDGPERPRAPASVVWTERALTLLGAIHTYIAAASPVYAARVVDRVLARVEDLATFPESGRQIPEYGAVELREVLEGPYRILYRYRPEARRIEVLAVVHGRQLLPPRP